MRQTIVVIAAALLLTACPGKVRKPDLPSGTVIKPEAIVVERRVYVPIPAHLTEELPVAEGPIEQCWPVAADRKAQVEKANARFREIAEIEGTVVEGDTP